MADKSHVLLDEPLIESGPLVMDRLYGFLAAPFLAVAWLLSAAISQVSEVSSMRNQGSTAAPPRSRRSIWQNISVMLFAVALGISAASSLMKGAAGVTTINVATAVLGISVVVGIVAYYDDPQMDSVIRLPLQGVKAATRTISVIAGLLILAALRHSAWFGEAGLSGLKR